MCENEYRIRQYDKFCNEANNRIEYNYEQQDKMVLSLCVVLLVLFPFISDKIEKTYFVSCILILFLIANFITLASTLLSFYLCSKGNEVDMKYAEKYYIESDENYFNKQSGWTRNGIIANYISLFSMIVSLLFFSVILYKLI